ncbi:hypothetical protein EJD97_010732 [Solanum chilense]|uniref:Uncharacterized protein n=2 Tax=Solanum subgen. Lycopersicon TaxID=49274 RepID=A0A3Q7JI21_SOLLC|nr:hypothetical protein EJD97_010732 [Solanum chilense]
MSKQVISSSVYCEKGEKVPQICRKTERKLSFELKLETIEEENDQKYGGQFCKMSHSSYKLANTSSNISKG